MKSNGLVESNTIKIYTISI